MFGWSWSRIGIALVGAATIAAGFIFPPASVFTAPIGAGLVGLAIKTPGDVSKQQLVDHGHLVAQAVAPAVMQAVLASQGKTAGQLGQAVAAAAAAGLAQAKADISSTR